jgi:hypothetical protein
MQHTTDDKLLMKLHTALRHAKHVCIFGSTNKADDVIRTGGWVMVQRYRYSRTGKYVTTGDRAKKFNLSQHSKKDRWFFTANETDSTLYANISFKKRTLIDPFNDSAFDLQSYHLQIIYGSLHALLTRSGKCASYAMLIAKYLWENPEGVHRIERFSMEHYDHTFIVINREGDEPNKPETWGNAWVIDGWVADGLIFHARELKRNLELMRDYMQHQEQLFQAHGVKCKSTDFSQPLTLISRFSFDPCSDVYPAYQSHQQVKRRFEEFYHLLDYRYGRYPSLFYRDYREAKAAHAVNFAPCLLHLNKTPK